MRGDRNMAEPCRRAGEAVPDVVGASLRRQWRRSSGLPTRVCAVRWQAHLPDHANVATGGVSADLPSSQPERRKARHSVNDPSQSCARSCTTPAKNCGRETQPTALGTSPSAGSAQLGRPGETSSSEAKAPASSRLSMEADCLTPKG
jgi:hypothetical protein